MSSALLNPIEFLKSVGATRAELLRKELGIRTYGDLLQFFPFRYIDRTRYYKIRELVPTNAEVQIIGKIIRIKTIEGKKGSKRLSVTLVDETGQLELLWFQNYKWIKESLQLNVPLVVFGKVTHYNGAFSMAHPEMETLDQHQQQLRTALQPVYSSTENLGKKGVTSRVMSGMMQQLFQETQGRFQETLPDYMISQMGLMPKAEALFNMHFPTGTDALARAQFRLKFEELFYIQLRLLLNNLIRKHKIQGHVFSIVGDYFNSFYARHLPFELTDAQKRVIKEIRADMGSNAQMNRLLQGDVGSGKTIVALMSMLIALDNGFQSCLMAPTEILANQHFAGLSELAEGLGINIRILTGSTKAAERKVIQEELITGKLHILIGTHALLEDKVQFDNLGLAVIDEQHRFGVEQRSKLWKKGDIPPHVLVMTATPIPRTLAMSLYGDLDVSVIDELPPGRKPIQTIHRYDSHRLAVWKFLKDEIAKGRQAYIVYPLIQESEKMDYKDLMDGYESISRDFPLPQYSVSIVHGKMKPSEKDSEMARFAQGKTNIMVATTVIEVGVNVPNASVMVIESAERFGLSQLHQLRGRVGRGAEQSYCILMTGHKLSSDTKTRLETMTSTNDGFEIAEVDLRLRGPGDLMGTQQSGVLNLRIADIVRDKDILQLARNTAMKLLKEDPGMQQEQHQVVARVYTELSKNTGIWNYIS